MNEFEAPKRLDEFALEIDQLSLEGVLVWADVPSNDLFVWRQRQQQQQRTSLIDLDEVIEKRQVKSENFLRLPSKLHSTFVEKKKTKRRSRNCSFPETMTPQMKMWLAMIDLKGTTSPKISKKNRLHFCNSKEIRLRNVNEKIFRILI